MGLYGKLAFELTKMHAYLKRDGLHIVLNIFSPSHKMGARQSTLVQTKIIFVFGQRNADLNYNILPFLPSSC